MAKKLRAKSSKKKDIILRVEPSYEISNGMLGMMRDVLFRLCHIIEMRLNLMSKIKDTSIKALIGMCWENTRWKNHSFFLCNRIKFIASPTSFRCPGLIERCKLTHSVRGDRCAFSAEACTAFLDLKVTEGIFHWTLQIEYGTRDSSYIRVGFAHERLLFLCDILGTVPDTSALWLSRLDGSYLSDLKGIIKHDIKPCERAGAVDHCMVAVEIVTKKKEVSFFVDGRKLPYVVSKVPLPMYFGVSGCDFSAVTSVSICRQKAPTQSAVACTYYVCGKLH